jgi:hypothetical protein
VYRGAALGGVYQGRYFFADYVSSRVWSLGLRLDPGTGEAAAGDLVEHTSELGGSLGGIASFGRDRQGELYLLTFAGQVRKIVLAGAAPPAAPENLQAVVMGSTVTVRWSPPASGPAPASYRFEAGLTPGSSNLGVVSTPATDLTFTGVPGGTYYARVRSVGAGVGVLVSAPSNEVSIVVGAGGCTGPPPAPAGLAASVTSRQVTLTWNSVTSPDTFQIEAGSATSLTDLAILDVGGTQRALVVTASTGRYFVRIRARNACGTSGASNEIVVVVQP